MEVENCQLSTVNCQLSTHNCQFYKIGEWDKSGGAKGALPVADEAT